MLSVGKITLGLLLVTLALSFFHLPEKIHLFDIKDIRIVGTKAFVNEIDVRELAESRALGQNLIFFDGDALRLVILDTFQGAESVVIKKKLPSTVVVEVYERVPLAVVYNDTSNEKFLVDDAGYVLGIVDASRTNLPEIKYNSDIMIGRFLDQKLVPVYLSILGILDGEKISVSSVSIYGSNMHVYVNKAVEVIFDMGKNVKEESSVLSTLLKQLSAEGKKAKRIDLRYDKVVVSY